MMHLLQQPDNDLTYSLTMFNSVYNAAVETNSQKTFGDWLALVHYFFDHSGKTYSRKDEMPLFSPAIFLPNSQRNKSNVISWGNLLVADIDHIPYTLIPELAKLEPLPYEYSMHGNEQAGSKMSRVIGNYLNERLTDYAFLCHSTASCTPDDAKCRLIMPLSRPVNSSDKVALPVIQHSVEALWSGLYNFILAKTGIEIDKQVKDLSRAYFMPGKIIDWATYHSSTNFIFSHTGSKAIDPNWLIQKYSAIPTYGSYSQMKKDERVKALKDHYDKHYVEANTNHHWTSWKDCKYFPKKLAEDYANIVGAGWYVTIYKIMCGIAVRAKKDKCPITAQQITTLIKEFDRDHGGWYQDRPLEREANNAISFSDSVN